MSRIQCQQGFQLMVGNIDYFWINDERLVERLKG